MVFFDIFSLESFSFAPPCNISKLKAEASSLSDKKYPLSLMI